MEKFFNQDAAYEKWDRKNKNKGQDNYFEEEENKSYLKGLKGRVQNNLSGFLRIVLTALMVLIQCVFIIVLPFPAECDSVFLFYMGDYICHCYCGTCKPQPEPVIQAGMDFYSYAAATKRFYYVLPLGA